MEIIRVYDVLVSQQVFIRFGELNRTSTQMGSRPTSAHSVTLIDDSKKRDSS